MNDSRKLLDDYAKGGSEAAFRELVARYVNMVHSTALRLVNGDAYLAEDVTQTVFLNLARKAGTLSGEVIIGGWLHRHACFVASTVMRGNRRRQNRERQAVEMNATDDHSAANLSKVAPLLDEAINELGPEDRKAILLRFFEQLEFRALGDMMGTNEDAARMRVNRALDKLHSMLSQRGVTLSAAALGAALAAEVVMAAPIGMAASVATAALSGAATGGATLTLVKIMSMTQIKIAIVSAIAVAVLAAPVVLQHQSVAKLREENQALQQQAAQLTPLQTENQRLSNLLVQVGTGSAAAEKQVRDLARLRAEVANLRQQTNDMAKAMTDLRKISRSLTGPGNGKRRLRNMTMAEFAKFIGGVLQAPVANQTGLPGTYDLELTPPRIGGEDGKLERVTGILLNELGLKLIPFSGPFTDDEEQFEGRAMQSIQLPDGTMTNATAPSNGRTTGFAIELDHYDAPGFKPSTGDPEPAAKDLADSVYVDAETPNLPRAIANTLRSIDGSKQQWALEKRKQNADVPTWEDIRPYLNSGTNGGRRDFIKALGEENFVLGAVGEKPRLRYPPGGNAVIVGGNAAANDPVTAKQYQCINVLRLIDSSKMQWALENRKQATDAPTMEDLRIYLGREPGGELPACPEGGVYTVGAVGQKPTCSIPGHVLP
jgi:RNA polymerase sigma factor (sigma-70 family)